MKVSRVKLPPLGIDVGRGQIAVEHCRGVLSRLLAHPEGECHSKVSRVKPICAELCVGASRVAPDAHQSFTRETPPPIGRFKGLVV